MSSSDDDTCNEEYFSDTEEISDIENNTHTDNLSESIIVHDALQSGQLLDEGHPSNHSEQQIGSEAAEQLRKWLQTTECNEQDTFSPQFVLDEIY